MVKIVHTSDWHLGAKLHDRDRGEEQGRFLDWLHQLLEREHPDALLVSGDVFDVRQPTTAAQSLYYDFIANAAKEGVCSRIVVTAGNHDSASMLAAADEVLKRLGVTVIARTQVADPTAEVVVLPKADGSVALGIAAVPYLNDGDLLTLWRSVQGTPDEGGESLATRTARLADGFRAHYAAVLSAARAAAPGVPLVAMGHACLSHAQVSDLRSERGRRIGGLDSYDASVFAGVDYVAMGHLHIPQTVGEGNRICYAGSPLQMSFAEAEQKKFVNIVTFGERAGDPIEVRQEEVPIFLPLRCFRGDPKAIKKALKAALKSMPAENGGDLCASVQVTEGEGELSRFWKELDGLLAGSPITILLKEDGRPKAKAGEGIRRVSRDQSLRAMTPLEIAELRIGEESHLTEEERATYSRMVSQLIGGVS